MNSSFDKNTLKRIEDIEQLDGETKKSLFFLIDNVIQNFKTKQAFAKWWLMWITNPLLKRRVLQIRTSPCELKAYPD